MEQQLLKSIASKMLLNAIIFALCSLNIYAQITNFDTKGKEFYLSFPPNYHSPDYSDYHTDSIYVYISAENPTNVTIEFTKSDGQKDSINLNITDPSKFYSFSRYFDNYELMGDYNNLDNSIHLAETVEKQSVHITSDEEINVYGLSASTMSSDAFLVFPKDVLGLEYFVMSYSSDQNNKQNTPRDSPNKYTPSQFVITATEDATQINITPSSTTSKGKSSKFAINLNKGESYVVQAEMSSISAYYSDLTGTYISADKPIAVFGGHQRSALPVEIDPEYSNASRDVLVDQVPPLTTWGKNAFVIPFPTVSPINDQYNDKYRILSATDNNKIKINSTEITLNKGKFHEGSITNFPISISAQDPILVAQFKKSARLGSMDSKADSDPLMIVIPPKEQFIKKAKLFNMQKIEASRDSWGNVSYTDIFTSQYIVIVSPDSAINNCTIDNRTLNPTYFTKIPNSEYSFYLYSTNSGVHDFESTSKCGLYVIAYGEANSYGYVGGMELKNIRDTLPPIINIDATECYKMTGSVIDDLHDTEGLQEITVVQELIINVNITLPTNYIGKARAEFTVELNDKTQDGIYAIKVIDKQKNEMLLIDTIQGNTLVSNVVDGVDNEFGIVPIANEKCQFIQFENKGILPFKYNQIKLNSGFYYSIPQSQLPFMLAPGEKKDLMVCFATDNYTKTKLTDSIMLFMDCYSLVVPLSAETDKIINTATTKCGMPIKLTLSSVVTDLFFDDLSIDVPNTTVKLIFGIPKQSQTKIVVFDIFGNEKQVLLYENTDSGLYEMDFSYQDYESGIYFVNLINSGGVITRKLLLNR